MKLTRLASAFVVAGLLLAPHPGRARSADSLAVATGVLTGRAFIAQTGEAAGYSNVILLGTRRGVMADSAGHFLLSGLPVGRYNARVYFIGFSPQLASCEVHAGETTFVNVALDTPSGGIGMRRYGPALRESLGVDVPGAGDSLVCTIEPFCSHVWLGERPRFRVRVWNRGTRDVFLVPYLDGSDGRRCPRVQLTYDGPPGGARRVPLGLCGNLNGMEVEELRQVPPGGSLDVFGASGFVDPWFRFTRAGIYVAHVEYATDENNLRAWLGDFQPAALGEDWRARFRHMPRVDLHAQCAFEVQQR